MATTAIPLLIRIPMAGDPHEGSAWAAVRDASVDAGGGHEGAHHAHGHQRWNASPHLQEQLRRSKNVRDC